RSNALHVGEEPRIGHDPAAQRGACALYRPQPRCVRLYTRLATRGKTLHQLPERLRVQTPLRGRGFLRPRGPESLSREPHQLVPLYLFPVPERRLDFLQPRRVPRPGARRWNHRPFARGRPGRASAYRLYKPGYRADQYVPAQNQRHTIGPATIPEAL